MFIWLALLIPVVTTLILLFFFHHRTKWWEFAIPFAASLLLVGICKLIAGQIGLKDMEVWNHWVVDVRYYEPWDEYIHRTCSYTTCSGSGKDQTCTTHYYDCSYVAYHPEYWAVVDSGENTFEISQEKYRSLVKKFEVQPFFVELNRNYHSYDGNMYKAPWSGTVATLEPDNISYSYANRVQAARSVFNYETVTEEQAKVLGLFEYPKVSTFDYPSVLGNCGDNTKEANAKLRYWNAVLGHAKELRMWMLCTASKDPNFGRQQEAYWVGGNKNEVVVILGDGWTHVFSWTDSKTPLVEIRNYAAENRDPLLVADFMADKLASGFVRKHFEDFDYLTIEPPTWYIVLTFCLVVLLNGGVSYFVIVNEHHDDEDYVGYGARGYSSHLERMRPRPASRKYTRK